MQLPLNFSTPETDDEPVTVVVVDASRRKKSRRHMLAAAPWKEDRGAAAIVCVCCSGNSVCSAAGWKTCNAWEFVISGKTSVSTSWPEL